VHVLFHLSRNQALASVVEELKKRSSKWVKTKGTLYRNFHWQSGYGAFSVSQSKAQEVAKYVAQQDEHHRRKTFQEEFRAFLKRHGVPYDERYVWD
jgi:REP element-mobilizing transposase RayT